MDLAGSLITLTSGLFEGVTVPTTIPAPTTTTISPTNYDALRGQAQISEIYSILEAHKICENSLGIGFYMEDGQPVWNTTCAGLSSSPSQSPDSSLIYYNLRSFATLNQELQFEQSAASKGHAVVASAASLWAVEVYVEIATGYSGPVVGISAGLQGTLAGNLQLAQKVQKLLGGSVS